MTAMTPRERVLTALAHQEPDRVPVALGGGPYGLVDALYFRMLDHLGLGAPVAPFREGFNISYLDDRVLERLGVDFRYVWPGDTPNGPAERLAADRFRDGFGQEWIRAVPYYYAGEGVLAQAERVDDIDNRVRWPDPRDPRWTVGVAERARALHEAGEHFIAARMVTSYGPYQTCCNLRGTEQFLLDLALNETFAAHLIGRVTDTIAGLMGAYLAAGGRYFDLIELPGDDYAGNTNLLMSPKMFRKYFKPALQRLVRVVKEFRPETKVMLHSDGKIAALLPDLVEIGVDVVHPLEPLPGVDLAEIKRRFGGQLSFLGAIDISHAMPGTVDDVRREARRRIAGLAPGGGYILAPSNHLQEDVPPENVTALFAAAREFGRYPIRLPAEPAAS